MPARLWSLQILRRVKHNELRYPHNYLFSNWWSAIFFSVQEINLPKSQLALHKINKAEHAGNNSHMFIYVWCLQLERLRWKIDSKGCTPRGFTPGLGPFSCCLNSELMKHESPLKHIKIKLFYYHFFFFFQSCPTFSFRKQGKEIGHPVLKENTKGKGAESYHLASTGRTGQPEHKVYFRVKTDNIA